MTKFKISAFGLIILIFFGFSDTKAQISVIFPNGGEKFIQNVQSPHNIIWSAAGIINIKIEFSQNNGSSWQTVEELYTQGEEYNWLVPDIISLSCLIKVSDADNPAVFDISDNVFSITDQKIHYAQWTSSMGSFTAELRGDLAPVTVQNFMNLAYRSFYNNLVFHRVIAGFMIQDGDPLGNGTGGPGYEFDNEISPWLNHSYPGVLAMANAGPNTNGSQYYITVAPTSWLDGSYSIFGRITDGMNVVYAISKAPTDANDHPTPDIDIFSVNIVESVPNLSLSFPQSGASLIQDDEIKIEWESDFFADLKIEFSADNGSNWTVIKDSIAADSSNFIWNLPQEISQNCFIKITDLRNSANYAMNDIPFEIRIKPAILNRIDFFENVYPNPENEENRIFPGKHFKFKIKIFNNFDQTFSNLSATIESKNTFAQTVTSQVSFPETAPGNYSWSNEEFDILLSENVPPNGQYDFSIKISDTNFPDIPWINELSLPIPSYFNFFTVDDDNNGNSSGNNNHNLEPGETIEFKFPISNPSTDTLYNVIGQLYSEAPYLNVWDNQVGVSETIYNTSNYNASNPIIPGGSYIMPDDFFVADYTASSTYQTPIILKLDAYIHGEQGTAWDNGGIQIKWALPKMLNSAFPSNINSIENNDFKILENPAKNRINFSINADYQNFDIFVFDILGNKILSKNFKSQSNIYSINSDKLKSGIYIVKYVSKTKSFSEKVIILK